jgi:hypothetical protein
MATTTNYGWDTPDDTDLVKDGAAAIRTLGSSIDTTTKNLNPETTTGDIAYRSATANTNTRLAIGSTGQVLTVAAGVPSWATPTDQTPLTTKGDVFTFSTVDARLGVGANGTVLTADSAETTGLKWVAPASPSFVGWYLYNSAVQSLANATNTNITMDSEFYDTNGFHTGSNATITIPSGQAGKYLLVGAITYAANSSGQRYANFNINSSGATNPQLVFQTTASGIASTLIVNVWDLAVNDTVALQGNQTSGGNLNVVVQNKDITYFSGAKIG